MELTLRTLKIQTILSSLAQKKRSFASIPFLFFYGVAMVFGGGF
jgi:hypothetical protein